MSWSITVIGKPENVAVALELESNKMDGQSKIEYESALPNLVGLVKENFGNASQIIKISANGHGFSGDPSYRQCAVSIESLYGSIV